MNISRNSQLGLMFSRPEVKAEYAKRFAQILESDMAELKGNLEKVKKAQHDLKDGKIDTQSELYQQYVSQFSLSKASGELDSYGVVHKRMAEFCGTETNRLLSLIRDDGKSKYFFICESVYRAAELIKINEGYTARTLKDIDNGHYTYLMGKDQMVRFMVAPGAISGFFYNSAKEQLFEFGFDTIDGGHFCPDKYIPIFSMIVQVLTFVELGDIEVVMLDGGRNNGKAKKDGKITNTSSNTIFVVDSSWNKMIIRTTGFAVRGHFRLQPCGPGMADRKLMWINAFEKHGYKRKARAKVIHD